MTGPYIVTTKRPVARWMHTQEGKQDIEAMRLSRRAVATLDEAQPECPLCNGSGSMEVPAAGSWEEHGTVYAECSRCRGSGRLTIPESGGTVGPLPDETVIEVEETAWIAIWRETGCGYETLRLAEEGMELARRTLLVSYNARQEVT